MTIASVVTDLKAGGDKGKLTWLASCGLEFPEVPGKVIEVVPGTDSILLKIAFVTSDDEFEKANDAQHGREGSRQPAAARVEKGSAVHFTGTLTSYDPDPTFFPALGQSQGKGRRHPEGERDAEEATSAEADSEKAGGKTVGCLSPK